MKVQLAIEGVLARERASVHSIVENLFWHSTQLPEGFKGSFQYGGQHDAEVSIIGWNGNTIFGIRRSSHPGTE